MESTPQNAQVSDALKDIFSVIETRFGARLLGSAVFRGELTFTISPEDLPEVAGFCKEDDRLAFDRLECLIGNHYPERTEAPFEVIVHLTSVQKGTRLRLKAPVEEGHAVPTLTGVWASAGWDEREAWEMYGIEFAGHPDMRRLLTLPDFEGHPFRKDFPLRGTYGGRIRTDLKGKL